MNKLLKVTMEFDDKIQFLEGVNAQKWLDACNGSLMMEAIHGREVPAFEWTIIRKNGS